jgi:MoaA/NifB/PqqE/SkfB family radical SAM enzyme
MSLLKKMGRLLSHRRFLKPALPAEATAMSDAKAPLLPKTFFLELTNHCNLRCSMCNFHSPSVSRRREKGYMQTSLALRLLDEIAGLGPERPWIALHGAGEPLLHKDLPLILTHGASLGLDVGFLTNGMLLDREMTSRILDTGITWIGFSIDGIDKEKFDKYRCGADYDLVVGNVLTFIEQMRLKQLRVRTMVNMTMQDEMKADVPGFVKFWRDKVDEVMVSPMRPIGSRDNALAREMPETKRVPCYMLTSMMVIFWNGEVGLCCEDWFNDGRMGDTNCSSLREIWNGTRFSEFRSLDETGRQAEIPLCGDCNSWHNAIPIITHDKDLDCTVRKTAWQYSYTRGRKDEPG